MWHRDKQSQVISPRNPVTLSIRRQGEGGSENPWVPANVREGAKLLSPNEHRAAAFLRRLEVAAGGTPPGYTRKRRRPWQASGWK